MNNYIMEYIYLEYIEQTEILYKKALKNNSKQLQLHCIFNYSEVVYV